MPTVRDDFVDRTNEIELLNSALHDQSLEKDSIVFVYGQSGIGKTQLLARFLRICRFNDISIVYVDLPDKDYLGLIDKIEEELGPDGFQTLESAYDDVILRSQMVRGQVSLPGLHEQQLTNQDTSTQGFVFHKEVSAETQYFVNGSVTFKNPKITNVYNLVFSEPEPVKDLSERKITQAFYQCLRTLTQEKTIAILLDHWEGANDAFKTWLKNHLIQWASELSLKNGLVVLCREEFPTEFEHQTGILALALPEFTREIALEYWMKSGLREDEFNGIDMELCRLPKILALEIDRRRAMSRGKQ